MAPAEYLQRIRLDRAKKLLGASARPITEIALECGFGSSAYLAACFTGLFGLSPSAYRASLQNGRIPEKNRRKTKD